VAIIWTFKSLFEIHHYAGRAPDRLELLSILFLRFYRFTWSTLTFKMRLLSILFLRFRRPSSRSLRPPGPCLSILFLRFGDYHGWIAITPEIYAFQFSFWDSSSRPFGFWLTRRRTFNSLFEIRWFEVEWEKVNELKRPFNSLFEIRGWRWGACEHTDQGDRRLELSILFLRFPISELLIQKLSEHDRFQFSFWDSDDNNGEKD